MQLKSIRYILFVFFAAVVFGFPIENDAFAGMNINLVIVNPTNDATKEVPVKYYLPKELTAGDILNADGLELDYDLDRSAYFMHGTVKIKPKETKTIKIEVNDVWQIKKEEVDLLKEQVARNLAALQGTQYYSSAQVLKDQMFEKLDYILAQQQNYSDNIERRIEEYRAHAGEIEKIKKNAFSSEYFKSTPTEGGEDKTVKFVVEVKNPSTTDSKKVTQRHYLPAEVRAEDVVEAEGFDIRFDEKKQQSYITKEEEFKPGENKRYEIVIKDIWNIPDQSLEDLRGRAQAAFEGVKGTEYESGAAYILQNSLAELDKIIAAQKTKQDMKKYIGAYRTNKKLLDEAQESIMKLELMMVSVRGAQDEQSDKSQVKNVLQKMQALRGIMAISEAVFGRKPTITNTWRVIWGILAFVAIFTAVHFYVWWRRSQVMGEDTALKTGGGVIKEITAIEQKEEKIG